MHGDHRIWLQQVSFRLNCLGGLRRRFIATDDTQFDTRNASQPLLLRPIVNTARSISPSLRAPADWAKRY